MTSPTPMSTITPTLFTSPTPTVPQPTVNPCDGECITPSPEVTPEVTRVPEPTKEPKGEPLTANFSADFSQGGVTTCSDLKPTNINDVWLEDDAVGNGELIVRWGVNSNYSKVHIVYGFEAGDIRYSLLNTENDGREVIGQLDSRHYWFSVANVNGCAVSDYVQWVDPMP